MSNFTPKIFDYDDDDVDDDDDDDDDDDYGDDDDYADDDEYGDDDYDYDDDDYLHPSRHIVPLCTIGNSTGEIVTRSTPTHDAMTV